MDKQARGEFMHPFAFGEGKRSAHEASEPLAQGVVPAFAMAGFAFALVAQAVSPPREHLGLGQPEVTAGGPATVPGRGAEAQPSNRATAAKACSFSASREKCSLGCPWAERRLPLTKSR